MRRIVKKNNITIAIDGPAGSGKSTVAKRVAEALGILYLDTGAMYRAVTLKALREGILPTDEEKLAVLAGETDLAFVQAADGTYHLFMDGQDVSAEIRSAVVTRNVSAVSAVPRVREVLVKQQQIIAGQGGVVMDGRDIGTVVLPQADLKIYLTASLEERARRRWLEMKAKGFTGTKEEIAEDLKRRDAYDAGRAVSPLKPAPDSINIDTSALRIEEVVERILELSSFSFPGQEE
ncbi:MAG TPA: (d)CMP kinase [Firmicutes bacterium]|nr:(d)CMP kinase [Bacillota bacterium]